MDSDLARMEEALAEARRAAEAGEVPVGAVLVTAAGRAYAAHNAPVSRHDASAHAEMRAIRAACRAERNYRLTGSTLYVTLEPCLMCAGLIVHARVRRVVYGAPDPKTGAVESLYRVLSDRRLNHRPEVVGGVMGESCGSLLRDFFRARRGG